jgi:uncharacterized protein (TIGR03435 family)
MSEQIYAWLLRLYPSRFQETYRDEALQLFRDRARDERGFLSGLRLWLDLLSDLAVSIPRSRRTVAAAVATAHDSAPSFLALEDGALNLSSFFYGVIASVMIYAVVLILAGHAGASLPIRYSGSSQPANYAEAAAGASSAAAAEVPNGSNAIGKPAPRASLSYTPLPPTSESTVNITAKIFGLDGRPTPTGNVRFFDGDALVGIGELNHGGTQVTGKLPELAQHFLRAVYTGDSNYSASASPGLPHAIPPLRSAAAAAAARGAVKPLTFEVVSIREDKSGAGLDDMTMGVTPDGFRARNVPLLSLIQGAYRPSEGALTFRLKQISGLPTWAMSEIRYDVDARVSEADLPAWKDPALQPEMLRSMLQAMLADRFRLAVHRETKTVPVYDLTVGNSRPKLTPYNGATLAEIQQKHPGARTMVGWPVLATGPNPGQQWFFGVTVSELGTLLSNLAGRPVLDRTGLKGRYDATYQIELPPSPPSPADGVAPPPPSPDSDFFRSQISTIVQDQLGLKLKPGTGPVESLVIDHVQQLAEN